MTEGGDEDLFLRLELARSGLVRGESVDPAHRDEICLASWSWGMQSNAAASGLGVATRATLCELRLRKRVDRSSPVLMSAMRSNDVVRRAVLAMRKAGGTPQDYLRVVLEDGRVTDYRIGSAGARSHESFAISFRSIMVEYRMQGDDGQLGGVVTFADEAR